MVARTRDVAFIRRTYRLSKFHGQIGGPIALLTAVAGLIVVSVMGIPFTSGWLIAAYIAFVLVMALGTGYHMRREMTIAALAERSPDAAPSPELAAMIADPKCMPAMWLSGFLWAFLVWVMVAKPF
ncbi:MAG: DUF2269 family protein [Candidatus Eremiobacteraeota bacterium]|nr:DUF2269 family protein [Candidatus Eremiobacteraeota bacterium]